MLDTLPVELLAHTLSFLDPFSPQRITPRRDLYNCCLVSRRLKDCAQPLLWRQVSVARLSAAAREAVPEGLGRQVRVLHLSGPQSFEGDRQGEIASLLRLPGVTDVRACGFQAYESSDLCISLLTTAQHITFDGVDIEPAAYPAVFSHLTSLSLFDQLSVLQIDAADRHCFDSTMADGPGALLVSFSVNDLVTVSTMEPDGPFRLRHLHLQYVRPEDVLPQNSLPGSLSQSSLDAMDARRQRHRQILADFPSFLARSHLSTLLLPLSLRHASLDAERQAILDACVAKGIEVLWEDHEAERGHMQCLREEICRWVAKKGRGEEQGER
ncbi:hypothetical protein JCM6882_004455 [Rhodosporidiobolus microsporus]